jgi:hypothetical protein
MVELKTNGPIRRCSSRANEWSCQSVPIVLNCLGNFCVPPLVTLCPALGDTVSRPWWHCVPPLVTEVTICPERVKSCSFAVLVFTVNYPLGVIFIQKMNTSLNLRTNSVSGDTVITWKKPMSFFAIKVKFPHQIQFHKIEPWRINFDASVFVHIWNDTGRFVMQFIWSTFSLRF